MMAMVMRIIIFTMLVMAVMSFPLMIFGESNSTLAKGVTVDARREFERGWGRGRKKKGSSNSRAHFRRCGGARAQGGEERRVRRGRKERWERGSGARRGGARGVTGGRGEAMVTRETLKLVLHHIS
jgi:hypothetical protein